MSRPLLLVLLAAVAIAAASDPLGGDAGRTRVSDAVITRVVDGDTVILAGVGSSRLIGIDTPEVHGSTECFGREASAFAERLLAGRRVRWQPGVEPRDRYGRALVYVWLADGRFVNELLVGGGFARTLQIAPNVRFADRLRAREQAAREAGRGLWSRGACRRSRRSPAAAITTASPRSATLRNAWQPVCDSPSRSSNARSTRRHTTTGSAGIRCVAGRSCARSSAGWSRRTSGGRRASSSSCSR